jgi:hypothetical protein
MWSSTVSCHEDDVFKSCLRSTFDQHMRHGHELCGHPPAAVAAGLAAGSSHPPAPPGSGSPQRRSPNKTLSI